MEECRISDEKINELLQLLLKGKKLQGISKDGFGRGVIEYIYPYICWHHYGSSANIATFDELKFICDEIFGDCIDFCTTHWSEYHVNYIPDEGKYKGIDLSSHHPNVYGL